MVNEERTYDGLGSKSKMSDMANQNAIHNLNKKK